MNPPINPQLPIKPPRIFSNKHWHECYISWLRSIYHSRSRSRDTIHHHSLCLLSFFRDKKNPNMVTRQDVEAFISAPTNGKRKKGTPPAAGTRNRKLAILSSFFRHALTYLVPFRGEMKPLLRGPSPTEGIRRLREPLGTRDIEEDEVARLFSVIPRDTLDGKRDRALLLCYLSTARRRVEIVNLRWGDIKEVPFADGRRGHLYVYKAKGRIESDTAEMPETAWNAIKEYLIADDDRWSRMQPESPIFRGHREKHALNRNVPTRMFKRYARRAGLPENVCLHSLRHYAAWEMYNANGHDIIGVAEFLGHRNTSIAQTMEYINMRKKRAQGNPLASSIAQKYARY